jgi:hypothetical protein
LEGVDLSDANLSEAELATLNLTETDLSDADLSGANLSEATVNNEQLDTAWSLLRATMPDEPTHDQPSAWGVLAGDRPSVGRKGRLQG